MLLLLALAREMSLKVRRVGLTATILLALLALCTVELRAQSVGEPLPSWTLGTLDIHQISTGQGNAALLIFPDGTSMLVDSGDGNPEPPRGAAPVPDGSRTAGEWIARYARRMLAHDPDPAIDYALITHFHGDHMGGFTEVAEYIPIRTMLDRGWPDYDYPRPLSLNDYRGFLENQRLNEGMEVERLQPGRHDQIVLQRQPGLYPSFEVNNVAANGEVWTGLDTDTEEHFPDLSRIPREDWPTENQCSLAIRVSYGQFDYYTGGDMPGEPAPGYPDWQGVETPVAKAVGPVDAAVLNHHGLGNGTTEFFVRTLQARVWVVPSRSADHPGRYVVDRVTSPRLYDGPRDVFAVTVVEATEHALGPQRFAQLASDQGHIVIRVDEGGESYRVIILDDSAEAYIVKAVHGPYQAK